MCCVLTLLSINTSAYIPTHLKLQRSDHLLKDKLSSENKDPEVLLPPPNSNCHSPHLSIERGEEPPTLNSLPSKLNVEDPFDWDIFLDTPFFDPSAVTEDQSSHHFLRQVALFIQNDYEKAEVILSGAFICIMIVVSQELVRFQIHGDSYVPFVGGSSSSPLF